MSNKQNADFTKRFGQAAIGEVVGTGVYVGSIYLARKMAPKQMERISNFIADKIAFITGKSIEDSKRMAEKTVDFALGNLGGLANMATQLALGRISDPENPLAQDVGRVIIGRIAGTAGAGASLGLAEDAFGESMRAIENGMATALGRKPGDDDSKLKLSERILSSLIQSVGAIPANSAAQALYDLTSNVGQSR